MVVGLTMLGKEGLQRFGLLLRADAVSVSRRNDSTRRFGRPMTSSALADIQRAVRTSHFILNLCDRS